MQFGYTSVGCMKNPEDKNKLIINKDTALIVNEFLLWHRSDMDLTV